MSSDDENNKLPNKTTSSDQLRTSTIERRSTNSNRAFASPPLEDRDLNSPSPRERVLASKSKTIRNGSLSANAYSHDVKRNSGRKSNTSSRPTNTRDKKTAPAATTNDNGKVIRGIGTTKKKLRRKKFEETDLAQKWEESDRKRTPCWALDSQAKQDSGPTRVSNNTTRTRRQSEPPPPPQKTSKPRRLSMDTIVSKSMMSTMSQSKARQQKKEALAAPLVDRETEQKSGHPTPGLAGSCIQEHYCPSSNLGGLKGAPKDLGNYKSDPSGEESPPKATENDEVSTKASITAKSGATKENPGKDSKRDDEESAPDEALVSPVVQGESERKSGHPTPSVGSSRIQEHHCPSSNLGGLKGVPKDLVSYKSDPSGEESPPKATENDEVSTNASITAMSGTAKENPGKDCKFDDKETASYDGTNENDAEVHYTDAIAKSGDSNDCSLSGVLEEIVLGPKNSKATLKSLHNCSNATVASKHLPETTPPVHQPAPASTNKRAAEPQKPGLTSKSNPVVATEARPTESKETALMSTGQEVEPTDTRDAEYEATARTSTSKDIEDTETTLMSTSKESDATVVYDAELQDPVAKSTENEAEATKKSAIESDEPEHAPTSKEAEASHGHNESSEATLMSTWEALAADSSASKATDARAATGLVIDTNMAVTGGSGNCFSPVSLSSSPSTISVSSSLVREVGEKILCSATVALKQLFRSTGRGVPDELFEDGQFPGEALQAEEWKCLSDAEANVENVVNEISGIETEMKNEKLHSVKVQNQFLKFMAECKNKQKKIEESIARSRKNLEQLETKKIEREREKEDAGLAFEMALLSQPQTARYGAHDLHNRPKSAASGNDEPSSKISSTHCHRGEQKDHNRRSFEVPLISQVDSVPNSVFSNATDSNCDYTSTISLISGFKEVVRQFGRTRETTVVQKYLIRANRPKTPSRGFEQWENQNALLQSVEDIQTDIDDTKDEIRALEKSRCTEKLKFQNLLKESGESLEESKNKIKDLKKKKDSFYMKEMACNSALCCERTRFLKALIENRTLREAGIGE